MEPRGCDGTHAHLASGGAADRQAREWREARAAFDRSRQLWLEFKQSVGLFADEAAKPETLAREIARCDAALAKLNATGLSR